MKQYFWCLFLSVFLAGCVDLSPQAPDGVTHYYQLDKTPVVARARQMHRGTLLVGTPTISDAFAGRSIAIALNTHAVSYAPHQFWVSGPAGMLQDLLVTALKIRSSWQHVATPPLAATADYRLDNTVTMFNQACTETGCYFELTDRVDLIQLHTGKLVRTYTLHLAEPCQVVSGKGDQIDIDAANRVAAKWAARVARIEG